MMPQKKDAVSRAMRWGKGLLAVAVWLGVLWKTYLWAGPDDVSPAMMLFLLGFVGVLVLPVIAAPLRSKTPWRWLGAYAVIWAVVYWGGPGRCGREERCFRKKSARTGVSLSNATACPGIPSQPSFTIMTDRFS